jgi:hypothetical protein
MGMLYNKDNIKEDNFLYIHSHLCYYITITYKNNKINIYNKYLLETYQKDFNNMLSIPE